jgi:hypothetical protein
MQAAPIIAGIVLFSLITISGFKLVPEHAFGSNNPANTAGTYVSNYNLTSAKSTKNRSLTTGSATPVWPVVTALTIKYPQDIERNSATLRGRVIVGPEKLGTVFFVYGTKKTDVTKATTQASSYTQVLDTADTTIQTKRVSRLVSRTTDVSTRVGGLAVDTTYYVQLCVEVETTLRCSAVTDFKTLDVPDRRDSIRVPTIRTYDEPVSGEVVTLTIQVDMRDMKEGLAYVVYGQSRSMVEQALNKEYADIEAAGELLQKTRVATNIIGSQEFTTVLDELDDETRYYYVACVAYDGRFDGFVCSSMDSFTTPDDSYGKSPQVYLNDVQVVGTTASFAGAVQMRSFIDGQVFFVYGTDADTINNIEGQRAMTNIRQNGDRLQRILVDSDVDASGSFSAVARDLRYATTYVVRLCVEFENVDQWGRDRLYIACSDERSFTTN